MTARSLHHLAIGARDVARLADFYRIHLGLSEAKRHQDQEGLRSVWLRSGETLLMIEATDQPARPVQGVGAGPFLIAFSVTPDERTQLEEQLHAAGFPAEARTEHSTYFRDPEGNRWAISHYPPD